jgi:2-dehydro-3-deoxy-L-rhamnonate dehydrogenase (NAD+)
MGQLKDNPAKPIFKNRFEGQVAIITGGAEGLGRGTAFRLASEGAKVVLLDRDEDKLKATEAAFISLGLKAESHVLDIAVEQDVKKALELALIANRRLDIMVNCAGIVGKTSTKIIDYDTDTFDKVIAVNLRGSFLISKYCLIQMEKQNYGRILLVASIAGKEGNPGMCAYSSSKAGVIGLVKAIGKEYAETGITVNGLAPAVIHTAMVEACTPEQVKYMTDKIPMKRTGKIEEVAALSAYIVSNENSFSTGFTYDISGGRATY